MIVYVFLAISLVVAIAVAIYDSILLGILALITLTFMSFTISGVITLLFAEHYLEDIPVETYPLVRHDEYSITYLDYDGHFITIYKCNAEIHIHHISEGHGTVTVYGTRMNNRWLMDIIETPYYYVVNLR